MRIKQAREAAGLSANQMVKVFGFSNFQDIESGAEQPSAYEVKKMAEIFDVNVLWLLNVSPLVDDSDLALVKHPKLRELLRMIQ